MQTDEIADVRTGGVEFEFAVKQTFYEFTPVEEIAEQLSMQARILVFEAFRGRKTAKGGITLKLHS